MVYHILLYILEYNMIDTMMAIPSYMSCTCT